MRARYLLLILLGVAIGQICHAGWEYDGATDKELKSLADAWPTIAYDARLKLTPDATLDADGRAKRRQELLALRTACLAYEDRCRKSIEANPGTLTHQYFLLQARQVTDRANNLLLWHDLVWLGVKSIKYDVIEEWDVEHSIEWARRRFVQAGGISAMRDGDPGPMSAEVELGALHARELRR